MHVVEDIDGVSTARGYADADGTCSLALCAPSGFVDGVFYPAESFTIDTREGIAALTELCQRILDAFPASPAEPESEGEE
jgi:hypothetical protein